MLGIIHLFFNDTLSITENIVIWINLIGSLAAVWMNIKAFQIGIPRFRRIGLIVGALALLFSIGYMHLLFFEPNYMVWAAVSRGIAMVSWPLVWIWPAFLSTQVWKELETRVQENINNDV